MNEKHGSFSGFPEKDLWEELKSRKGTEREKPIFLWGMGNGADKIIAALASYGLSPEGFFASDGFVRGQTFHEKKVLSFSEVVERYGEKNITVLVSFASSLPDVMKTVRQTAEKCELFLPDVPVCGDVPEELFTRSYFENRVTDFEAVRSLFEDETSKTVFDGVIRYRLSGKTDHLVTPVSPFEDMLVEAVEKSGGRKIGAMLDLGAYTGDTAKKAAEVLPAPFRLEAWEPDPKNGKKLVAACADLTEESHGRNTFEAVPFAAWSSDGTLTFASSGGRNAGVGASAPKKKEVSVTARSVDSRIRETGILPDLIKIDVEGAEKEVLLGAKETIKKAKPILLLSLYHRTDDLRSLPLFLHRHFPDYRFLLRRPDYYPAWDLTLIAY